MKDLNISDVLKKSYNKEEDFSKEMLLASKTLIDSDDKDYINQELSYLSDYLSNKNDASEISSILPSLKAIYEINNISRNKKPENKTIENVLKSDSDVSKTLFSHLVNTSTNKDGNIDTDVGLAIARGKGAEKNKKYRNVFYFNTKNSSFLEEAKNMSKEDGKLSIFNNENELTFETKGRKLFNKKSVNVDRLLNNATVLSNGVENNGDTPFTDAILFSTKKILESDDKIEIAKHLASLNEFILNEKEKGEKPEMILRLNDSVKEIFEFSRIAKGREPINTLVQEVLEENKELSKDLLKGAIDVAVYDDGESLRVDTDITKTLYRSLLQNTVMENDIIGKSKTINDLINPETIEGKDFINMMSNKLEEEDRVNTLDMRNLFLINRKLPQEGNKNEADLLVDEVEKKLENMYAEQNIEAMKSLTQEQQEMMTSAKEESTRKMNQQLEKAVGYSSNDLYSRLKKDSILKEEEAIAEAKTKKMREGKENTIIDAIGSYNEYINSNNIIVANFLYGKKMKNLWNELYNEENGRRNINPIMETLYKTDEYGNRLSPIGSYNRLLGRTTIPKNSLTDPVSLRANFMHLRAKNPPKDGEDFHLHLGFSGDRVKGVQYIRASIEAALNMEPPMDLENIHVPKEYKHVINEFKQDQGQVSVNKLPEEIDENDIEEKLKNEEVLESNNVFSKGSESELNKDGEENINNKKEEPENDFKSEKENINLNVSNNNNNKNKKTKKSKNGNAFN